MSFDREGKLFKFAHYTWCFLPSDPPGTGPSVIIEVGVMQIMRLVRVNADAQTSDFSLPAPYSTGQNEEPRTSTSHLSWAADVESNMMRDTGDF